MPPRTVTGKRVLVTGAASGIGRATALAAADRGARLCLTDLDSDRLEAVAEDARARAGAVDYVKALDVSDHDAVAAMAAEIHAEHGSLDVVMNIAGIAVWGTVDTLAHEQWRRVVDINLMGPIHVIESFVPAMIRAGRGGHLVNVSSAAGLFGLPWHAPYSATKFGLRGLSEVLRFDLRRHGIGVSLVCPGAVDTGLVETIEIAGVDRRSPAIERHAARFRRHAVTPERAAERILRGIERNRYWVYTSRDIQLGHFLQRRFELGYTLVMRAANDRFTAIMRKSAAEGAKADLTSRGASRESPS
jgi:NAD(P)-dependent dehydrogenase (short-subunit alcohol dehydrogenase family)